MDGTGPGTGCRGSECGIIATEANRAGVASDRPGRTRSTDIDPRVPILNCHRQAMALTRLHVHNLRILSTVALQGHARLNLLTGDNGAGKTSVLEAIHVLSTGRSFRTRRLEEILRRGSAQLLVAGEIETANGHRHRAGIERSARGIRRRLDGQELGAQAELARLLPVAVVEPDSHRLISGGPRHRRRFLDWGVFHVEHAFLDIWRRYERALRQRNVTLQQSDPRLLPHLDRELALHGQRLGELRRAYVERLQEVLPPIVAELVPGEALQVVYQPGWRGSETLAESLERDRERDRRRAVTHSGPHRADLRLLLGGNPAGDFASRGQQKALAAALVIGQVTLFPADAPARPVVLIDDLPSELDAVRRDRVLARLHALGGQLWVTAIDETQLAVEAGASLARFHVERGEVRELL